LDGLAIICALVVEFNPVEGDHAKVLAVVDEAVRVVDCPTQTAVLPLTLSTGFGLTVIVLVAVVEQLFCVTMYEITDVPDALPVTRPVALTVAIAELELDQIPPEVEFDS